MKQQAFEAFVESFAIAIAIGIFTGVGGMRAIKLICKIYHY